MRALAFLLALWPGLIAADPIGEAFAAAQIAVSSSAGSALRQTALRRAEDDGPLADLLRARQAAVNRAAIIEQELARRFLEPERQTRLAGEAETIRTRIDEIDAEIAASFPDFSALTRPEPLSLDAAKDLLAPDEALIFVFTTGSETYVWTLTPERTTWVKTEVARSELAESVASIRRSLGQDALLRAAEPFDEEPEAFAAPDFDFTSAWLIYRELFWATDAILEEIEHIYFVLDSPLAGLPLSLLITDDELYEGPQTTEAFRARNWFFQSWAHTVLPSVESLALIKAREAKPRDDLHLVGFGDPSLTGRAWPRAGQSIMDGALANPDALRALTPLPGTRRELARIARRFPQSDVFLGDQATEAVLRDAPLSDADVLHFATHGLLTGELEGLAEPALVLTPPSEAAPLNDGLLTASEISGLDLDADWVVLSACNTAGGDGRPDADGLSGLARAFLFAGARTLVVSHWPVRDDAAAELTSDMFDAWTEDPSRRKAAALQSAMARMLMASSPDLAHPSAWAPFILVGDGG